MILHHSMTTTSACKISDEMFFNKGISITFRWCINNFFLKALFLFFSLDFFLANLISLSLSFSLLGLESFSGFHLVSEFLFVSFSLTACCEYWLPCVKLSLHYENINSVYLWRKMHDKMKVIK